MCLIAEAEKDQPTFLAPKDDVCGPLLKEVGYAEQEGRVSSLEKQIKTMGIH